VCRRSPRIRQFIVSPNIYQVRADIHYLLASPHSLALFQIRTQAARDPSTVAPRPPFAHCDGRRVAASYLPMHE
jgi:hypothetical protein